MQPEYFQQASDLPPQNQNSYLFLKHFFLGLQQSGQQWLTDNHAPIENIYLPKIKGIQNAVSYILYLENGWKPFSYEIFPQYQEAQLYWKESSQDVKNYLGKFWNSDFLVRAELIGKIIGDMCFPEIAWLSKQLRQHSNFFKYPHLQEVESNTESGQFKIFTASKTWSELSQKLDETTRLDIMQRAQPEEILLLHHVDNIQAFYKQGYHQLDIEALKLEMQNTKTFHLIQETAFSINELSELMMQKGNIEFGRTLKVLSGSMSVMSSFANIIQNGASFNAFNVALSGVNALMSALSDNEDTLAEALQEIHQSILQCLEMLHHMMDYLVARDEYWRGYFLTQFYQMSQWLGSILYETQRLSLQSECHYLLLKDGINHLVKREHFRILTDAYAYGKDRTYSIADLNDSPKDALALLGDLRALMRESGMRYLNGEGFYDAQKKTDPSAAKQYMNDLANSGIYGYIAHMMSEEPEVKKMTHHLFEPLLFLEAYREYIRLLSEGVYHRHNEISMLNTHLKQLESFLKAIQTLQTHASEHFFVKEFYKSIEVINEIELLFQYDEKLLSVMHNQFWETFLKNPWVPEESLIIHFDPLYLEYIAGETLEKRNKIMTLLKNDKENCDAQFFNKNGDWNFLKPLLAAENLGLIKLYKNWEKVECNYQSKCIPFPFPQITLEDISLKKNHTLVHFINNPPQYTQVCQSSSILGRKVQDCWNEECGLPYFVTYSFSHLLAPVQVNPLLVDSVIEQLKHVRREVVTSKLHALTQKLDTWELQLTTMQDLLRQSCYSLGFNSSLCQDIPGFHFNPKALKAPFEKDLTDFKPYQHPLPNSSWFTPIRSEFILCVSQLDFPIQASFEFLSTLLENRSGLVLWLYRDLFNDTCSIHETNIHELYYVDQMQKKTTALSLTKAQTWFQNSKINQRNITQLHIVNDEELFQQNVLLGHPVLTSLTDYRMHLRHLIKMFQNKPIPLNDTHALLMLMRILHLKGQHLFNRFNELKSLEETAKFRIQQNQNITDTLISKPVFYQALLQGFLTTVPTELIGDIMQFSGRMTEVQANRLKLFIQMSMMFFFASIPSFLLSICITNTVYCFLCRWGVSKNRSRQISSAVSFLATQGGSINEQTLMLLAANRMGGHMGFQLEKTLIRYFFPQSTSERTETMDNTIPNLGAHR